MSKVLNIHTNISHLATENNYKVSAIGMMGEPSYLNLDVSVNEEPKISESVFSKREKQIIRLMAGGSNSKEIAENLNISAHTVKTHRRNILRKSECGNLVQLIAKCIKEGLI